MAEITVEEIYRRKTILLQLAFAAADKVEKMVAEKAASAKVGLKLK